MIEICLSALESDFEKEAFRNLYHRCRDLLFHVAMGFFHDPHRSEEAVQDAFLSAAKNFSKIFLLNAQEQDAYLVVIVKNKCRDILRREKKYAPEEDSPEIEPCEDSVHAEVERTAVMDRIVALIDGLPGQYREVLQRRLLLEQSNGCIAKAMGISESAASRRFEKGRAMLAEMLKKEGIGHA